MPAKKPIVVLISGNGSNLQALLDVSLKEQAHFFIAAVISNKSNAYGLSRARNADIPTHIIDHKQYQHREEFDQQLSEAIDQYQPVLVVLAGFMRILSTAFVDRYSGMLINIHPSLLPNYKGVNTHQRVLENGETHHGLSVHFVTAELDGGPVIMQAKINIKEDDSAESLKARVQKLEHIIYPIVCNWFAEGRLSLTQQKIVLDGSILNQAILYNESGDSE